MRVADLDVRDLRIAAGAMLAGGAIHPALPAAAHVGCPLRAVTGIPCPLCGMTTSVVATERLDLAAAVAANPAGIAAVLVAIWLLVRPPRRLALPIGAPIAALAAMWLFELHRFAIV